MIRSDYHTHTTYCDGKASMEEMVLAAIEKGMQTIGISGHAYTSRDDRWCMSLETTKEYIRELKRLQEKYAGKIEILLGTEQDYFSDGELEGYDYRIGSVHYVEVEGKLFEIDDSAEEQQELIDTYFGGDPLALAEYYYRTEADVLRKTGADVIGHFNLLEKFNRDTPIYDTASERYQSAWKNAVDQLIPYGKPFEINTGGISRGYRNEPYPDKEMMNYIAENGGCFILSSDSHSTGTLLYGFEELEAYLQEKGYRLLDRP